MAEPIRVAARRGGTVESIHRIHAVAVRDGQVVASAGDPELVTFMRSAAKPIQAFALARDATTSTSATSRSPRPRTWPTRRSSRPCRLSSTRLRPRKTTSSAARSSGSKLKHNCSGKHAGMLALCRAKGWPLEGYRLADHPCQQAMLAEVAQLAGSDPSRDGDRRLRRHHVALPLQAMATAFTRIDETSRRGRCARTRS